jgi:hypothetical protein
LPRHGCVERSSSSALCSLLTQLAAKKKTKVVATEKKKT